MDKTTTALEVAKYIIHLCDEYGELITHLKLQKLLYYVQANYLAKHKEPFFADSIEAWKYGPVVRKVWEKYNDKKREPLLEETASFLLTTDQKKHIKAVLSEYLGYSAYELVECVHQEAPWIEAYKCGDSTVITNESMRDFYSKKQEEQDRILAELEAAAANVE